jgi:hypothetical protein
MLLYLVLQLFFPSNTTVIHPLQREWLLSNYKFSYKWDTYKKQRALVDFVKHESVLLGLQLKLENSTDIENSVTVQAVIIF